MNKKYKSDKLKALGALFNIVLRRNEEALKARGA
jgi:hypothetical protein